MYFLILLLDFNESI